MQHKKNITLNLRSITSHFAEKKKIITLSFRNITLCSLILTLSSINIINTFTYIPNTSALSYQSSADVKFTFNPTLSISISPSDLIIDNLTPGTNSDSNVINVSVATNASHGYTLSATVGDSLHNNTNLTHTNGNNIFSSIATDASLSSLATDNTWGYSYRLSNNSNSNAWSNYSGLSNETSKTLVNTDNQIVKPIDFKIAAKASSTQPSGTYTNTINFIAISKPIPKTIEDIVYMQTFGELLPTDLQSVKDSMILNQDYILKDSRDEKEYYVTRLEDGNVWMTQNLDLDLSTEKPLTSKDTDLNDGTSVGYQNGYTVDDGIISWKPTNSTVTDINEWNISNTEPSSYDAGHIFPNESTGIENRHGLIGNYYNWTVSVASNNSNGLSAEQPNSICPKGWRIPETHYEDFNKLLFIYKITKDLEGVNGYIDSMGFDKMVTAPLWFILSGYINSNGQLPQEYSNGYYRYGDLVSGTNAGYLSFSRTNISPKDSGKKNFGFSLRCLAR